MALSVPIERFGLGLVEAALSQLPHMLLPAWFSNAFGVLVASALDQLPGALDIIICGHCVLCTGRAVPVEAALDVPAGH